MRHTLVAGNWKMNGSSESIGELLEGIKSGLATAGKAEIAVLCPFVYLAQVKQTLTGTSIGWGAQNLSEHSAGAFTGEVAASMLLDFDCKYVAVGHSERRTLYGETDAVVAQKYQAARKAGLIPILCVGETLDEREREVTEEVVARQLDAVLEIEGVQGMGGGVIAYEPVWAIGTGKTASPEQAQQVHAFIRSKIAENDATIADQVRILYGGSMKGANAPDLLAKPDIDGGLIGGASLDAAEFLSIAAAAP